MQVLFAPSLLCMELNALEKSMNSWVVLEILGPYSSEDSMDCRNL